MAWCWKCLAGESWFGGVGGFGSWFSRSFEMSCGVCVCVRRSVCPSLSKHFGSQFGALHDVLMAHGTSTGDAAADRFFAGLDVL